MTRQSRGSKLVVSKCMKQVKAEQLEHVDSHMHACMHAHACMSAAKMSLCIVLYKSHYNFNISCIYCNNISRRAQFLSSIAVLS